jgi:superfamily I DNA/RNA helicase
MPNHTAEQLAILSHMADTDDHLVINALAGTGKTTTILDGLSVLRGDSLLMAFNRSIADELRQKAARKFSLDVMSRLNISTVHSHGLKAFTRAGRRASTVSGKVSFLLKDHLNSFVSKDDDLWRNMGKVSRLVGAAKSAGFGLDSPFECFPSIADTDAWLDLADHYNLEEDLVGEIEIHEVCELARTMLIRSNQQTNSIDFDDMIYLPLLLNLPLPQYNNVLIDEAQDINATRRELAFRSLSATGRLIAVGDPNQAIYGFTGADVKSLDNIRHRANAPVLPLTICWRCDGAIITSAQEQVPEIKCRPGAEDAGQVLTIDFEADNFLDLPKPGDAILCRVNKPNVAVCLGLLRRGVRAKIEGRDIGKRLEQHVQKANPLYASQPLSDTLLDLETYKDLEIQKLVAKNKPESYIALLEDEIEAAALIIERCLDVANLPSFGVTGTGTLGKPGGEYSQFTALITELFGDDVSKAYVTLSSVHKAKGREWPRVFILGYADWMPHRMAKMPWEIGQEHNLIYVAKTRAERTLVLVNGAQSAIDRGLHREVKKPAVDEHPDPEVFALAAKHDMDNDPDVSFQRVDHLPRLAMPTLDQLKEYKK